MVRDGSDIFRRTSLRSILGSWIGSLMLVVLCLAVYLPGLTRLPAVDRDESRFAQASRQMVESGNWVVPMIQGVPRLNKPPLIYWAQAASAVAITGGQIARDAIWMYRLPSMLAAIATVLLTRRLGTKLFDSRTGFLAAAILVAAPVFAWEARQARADMVMVAFTTAAMIGLWTCFRSVQRSRPVPRGAVLLLWVAAALGTLTKGPITLLVIACTAIGVAATYRRPRWILAAAPLLGAIVVSVVCVPWLLAVMSRVGPDVYLKTVFDETLGRSMSPREGHWGPPGYHALFAVALLFPGSLCIGVGLRRAVACWRVARARARFLKPAFVHLPEVFLLAWLVPTWVIFELVSTKLPHYTMPLYPALALLCARAAIRAGPAVQRCFRRPAIHAVVYIWMGAIMLVILLGFAMLRPQASWKNASVSLRDVGVMVLAVAGAGAILKALLAAWKLRRIAWLLMVAVVAACGAESLAMFGLPRAGSLWITRSVMRIVNAVPDAPVRPICAVGYQEDSLIFETRGRAQRISADEVGAWLAANPNGLVVIDDSLLQGSVPLRTLGLYRGFNYPQGRWVNVVVAEAATP